MTTAMIAIVSTIVPSYERQRLPITIAGLGFPRIPRTNEGSAFRQAGQFFARNFLNCCNGSGFVARDGLLAVLSRAVGSRHGSAPKEAPRRRTLPARAIRPARSGT